MEDAVTAQGVFDRLRSSTVHSGAGTRGVAPRALPVQALEPRPRNYDRNLALIAISLGMLMVLGFLGQAVRQGVTEEKP